MARGRESKAVESRIETGLSEYDQEKALRTAEVEQRMRRSGLELSRRRITREIEETSSTLRMTSLKNALTFLDGELIKFKDEV